MKTTVFKIMGWAAIALVIPMLGNQFVEGWNWNWNDFVFAWVFWVLMATTILFLTRRVTKYRLAIGTFVFLVFVAIWVMLATG
jgi:FtsH-binding integral membrane protein